MELGHFNDKQMAGIIQTTWPGTNIKNNKRLSHNKIMNKSE